MAFIPPMVSALYDHQSPGTLHVFGVAVDGSVWHKPRFQDFPWAEIQWYPLHGNLTGLPTVVSWSGARLDVFGVGFDGAAHHTSFDGVAWQNGWDSLGGVLVGPLAVLSLEPNRLDVVGMGMDGGYYLREWNGNLPPPTHWNPEPGWQRLGDGVFLSPPTIVDAGSGRLQIVGMGMDRAYYVATWDGATWPPPVTWEKLGGEFQGPPAAVSWGPGRLDIFGQGMDGDIYHKSLDNGVWSPAQLGVWGRVPNGAFQSSPAVTSQSRPVVTSRGINQLDIFAVGTDGQLWGTQWKPTGWLPTWQALGGAWASAPVVAVTDWDQVDVFAVDSTGAISTNRLTSGPSGWIPDSWIGLNESPNGSFAYIAPPAFPFASGLNYFMSTTGGPIPDLTVNVLVNEAIVGQSTGAPLPGQSSLPGFSIQLNCYAEGPTTSQWQQFVFTNTGTSLTLTAQYWDLSPEQMEFDWCATTSLSFPNNTLPAGHILQIALSSAGGGPTDGITNVTFSVRTPDLVWHKHDTYFIPAPRVAPLVAATLVLVGPGSGERANLSSGAGTIEYVSSVPLSPSFGPPADADTSTSTAEQANSFYGLMSVANAPTHTQTFQIVPLDT